MAAGVRRGVGRRSLDGLKAAAIRTDITPEHPAILAGYAERTGRSTGIHDPLNASVVVFDDGESRAALVGLPGEPVVEYGLGIEHDLAALGKTVFVLGYCTGDAGYVPASHMIDEGGYEAEGPYSQDCERDIRDGVKRLIARLFAN